MAKLRSGPTFTQEILTDLVTAVEYFGRSDEHPDTAFRNLSQALQKFLHYGMSRFSMETLQNVVDDLIQGANVDKEEDLSIRSLAQLRTTVKSTMTRRDTGSLRTSDVNALKYIETYFYCVYCLSEAKLMFDKVYEKLYFAYFDPDGVSRQSTNISSARPIDSFPTRGSRLLEAEHYSQFGISTLQQMTGSNQHKLKQTARDMKDVLERWAELLVDEEPRLASFDPESEQDLHQLHGGSRSEPILRLVPDLFAKYYKCMELTKQWWSLARDAYPDLPFKRRPSETDIEIEFDFSRASSSGVDTESYLSDSNETTNKELEDTKMVIIENQKVINSLQEEIEALDKREEKFDILKETHDNVGRQIEDKKREQKRLRVERDRLNPDENRDTVSMFENNISNLDSSIRLLEFQHALLFEDFMIHMEIRPSIIRFQDDAKMHLKEAQFTQDRHMVHLQKLRDSNRISPSSKQENKVNRNDRVIHSMNMNMNPATHSTSSPEYGAMSTYRVSSDGQSIKEKERSNKTRRTSTVDERRRLNKEPPMDSKEKMIEKQGQSEIGDDTGSSKMENTARPNPKIKRIEQSEHAIINNQTKEKKTSILKHANSRQNIDATNQVQNSTLKSSVSKKHLTEHQQQQQQHQQQQQQPQQQVTKFEKMETTHDLSSKKIRTNPKEKPESLNHHDIQTSDTHLRKIRKDSVVSLDSRPTQPNLQSNPQRRVKKVNSESALHVKGDDSTKSVVNREELKTHPKRSSKRAPAATNASLRVKLK